MEKQALAGRYALGERVGAGGMADVFTARDLRLDRDVAIKLFRPGTADGLDRGSAEAKMLAGLDHPGLVRVLDMDNGEYAGDGAYLVMELIRGADLGVLLRSGGPMSREDVRTMALDLARTLQYIHRRGIVHRDIKPSNILTRDADPGSGVFRYLLTDFGIARFFDGGRMTATGQVIGSAAYFSPEQARGDDVGHPTDIYSLALVLIEALTNERAFPGTGVESALARLHRAPSVPHAAGPALSALLVSMTLDRPEDRPDAGGVLSALTVMGPQAGGDPTTTAGAGVYDPTGAHTAALAPVDTGTSGRPAHDTAAHDTAAHDTAAHDTAAHDTAAHDTAAHDAAFRAAAYDGAPSAGEADAPRGSREPETVRFELSPVETRAVGPIDETVDEPVGEGPSGRSGRACGVGPSGSSTPPFGGALACRRAGHHPGRGRPVVLRRTLPGPCNTRDRAATRRPGRVR
jgi:hypothetical protein